MSSNLKAKSSACPAYISLAEVVTQASADTAQRKTTTLPHTRLSYTLLLQNVVMYQKLTFGNPLYYLNPTLRAAAVFLQGRGNVASRGSRVYFSKHFSGVLVQHFPDLKIYSNCCNPYKLMF